MVLYEDIRILPKDARYFHNKKIATGKGHIKKLETEKIYLGKIGNHEFFSYLNKSKE